MKSPIIGILKITFIVINYNRKDLAVSNDLRVARAGRD